jgi:hypothetical protein
VASTASPRGLVTVGSVAAGASSPSLHSTEVNTSALKAEALAKHQAVLTQLQVRASPRCAFSRVCTLLVSLPVGCCRCVEESELDAPPV